jgi:hypothetical protein
VPLASVEVVQTAVPVVAPTLMEEHPGMAVPLSVKLMAPANCTVPAAPLTVAVKMTAWSTVVVPAEDVMDVLVGAAFTVWETAVLLLLLKFASAP